MSESSPQTAGKKFDSGKPPMALIPHFVLAEVGKVLAFGAEKYEPWNWAGGFAWSRLISAAQRHIGAFQDGEEVDPETQISHLAHAMCCLIFLLAHQLQGLGSDDRYDWGSK